MSKPNVWAFSIVQIIFTWHSAAAEKILLPTVFDQNLISVTPQTTHGRTLEFYTDTGGGWNMIRKSLASDIGLQFKEKIDIGKKEDLTVVRFPEFSERNSIPLPSESYFLGGGLAAVKDSMLLTEGFLGGKWFADKIWEFDYPRKTLHLLPRKPRYKDQGHRAALGFQINDHGLRTQHFPRISIEVEGEILEMLFDTGAMATLTDTSSKYFSSSPGSTVATGFIIKSIFERWAAEHPDWVVIENADRIKGSVFPMIRVPQLTIGGHSIGPVWFTQRPDHAFVKWMSTMMDAPIVGAVGGSAFQYFRIVLNYPEAWAEFHID